MLFDIVIAISCVVTGLFLGWVMHALHRSGVLAETISLAQPLATSLANQPPSERPAATESISAEQVSAVADRIRSFASAITASLDSHQDQVDAVSSTLHESDLSGAPPVILGAVEQLLSANESMREQLHDSQERLREQAKQLHSAEERAQTDALTGVPNRGAFDKQLERQFELGSCRAGALVLIDIDHFKRFNDEYGHRAGDAVLRSVALMLESRLEPHGMVARFGGEEFGVLVNSVNFEEALDLIEKARVAVSTRVIRFEEKKLKVTLSAGIGGLESGQPMAEWLQRVDDALYRSKECGRNCAHYLSGERILRVGTSQTQSTQTLELQSTSSATGSATDETNNSPSKDEQTQIASMPLSQASVNQASVNQASVSQAPMVDSETSTAASSKLNEIVSSLTLLEDTERPKTLSYLPGRDDLVEEMLELVSSRGNAPHFLIAMTLSGNPGGALMRSLLQIVRTAMRSQDRIGCVNHQTLIAHLTDCDEADVRQRAEQICLSVGACGIQLASHEHAGKSERLSIGILTFGASEFEPDKLPSVSMLESALTQSQAASVSAAQSEGHAGQPEKTGPSFPILVRPMRSIGDPQTTLAT